MVYYYPILKRIMEDSICFDITMVAEGIALIRTASEKAISVNDFQKICFECKDTKSKQYAIKLNEHIKHVGSVRD